MRRRFVVAALLSIPILLWSPVGRDVLNFTLGAPFELRDDIFQSILSLPVVFWAGWIFYDGAARALRARGGANEAIRALIDLAPPKATVVRDGTEVEIPTSEVGVGDLLLIRPGAKVAVDGTVEDGESDLDESMVTGESLPIHKAAGDQVIGATLNTTGTQRVRATKVGADTALAQIVKQVQEAQNSKAPGQRLADRAAFWLVLVALLGGAATFAVWCFLADRLTASPATAPSPPSTGAVSRSATGS